MDIERVEDILHDINDKTNGHDTELKIISMRQENIIERINALEKRSDYQHDKLVAHEASMQTKSSFMTFLSKHGISIIVAVMALGVLINEINKLPGIS